jgi:hypothetical protein
MIFIFDLCRIRKAENRSFEIPATRFIGKATRFTDAAAIGTCIADSALAESIAPLP